ncbi:DALR anticodon-binding domain-containing protein 3-like [Elysia marginata]|uniref:DALR anticodon-binding domain-containing protein 3-like n=1 Tax=Elysia marginata TaxID=1093978 RepID=A0AAV4HBJ5_9GAST|nr:DALR anticodon-binding domain-containing protein 3-like [Elysia marginata]
MESAFQAFQKSLKCAIHEALLNADQTKQDSLPKFILRKKVRDLYQGDIVVPAGCLNLNRVDHDKLMLLVKEYCASADTLTSRVTGDKYNLLSFHIDRPKMCGLVLKEVLSKGPMYGCVKNQQDQFISLHSINLKETTPLMVMRLAVIRFHAVKLLEANGYTVLPTVDSRVAEFEQLVDKFSEPRMAEEKTSEVSCVFDSPSPTSSPQSLSLTRQYILSKINSLSFEADPSNSSNCDTAGLEASPFDVEKSSCLQKDFLKCDGEGNVFIDLQSMISNNDLHQGKGGLDVNLKDVQVLQDHQPTEVLEESLRILHIISGFPQNTQSQMVIGPISVQETSQASSLSANDFYKSRLSQFKEASEMRSAISSDGCSDKDVKTLTDASIKIDILGNACNSPLTLENTTSGRGAESRLGAFILYNTARLSTLLQRFDQAVGEGVYPALPAVDLIDWALLREEEDWELVYVYLAAFPDIVSQSVECVIPADGKFASKIHSHKVTNFLSSFCKCLSAHYSRYHILTGRESHLLPLMYARLYMMKAAHQVLLNSLDLLGIQSLNYV